MEGVTGRVGRVGEELRAQVSSATSMVCPEDGCGRLTPAVLDVDGSNQKKHVQHLEAQRGQQRVYLKSRRDELTSRNVSPFHSDYL
jgi:hypothetical protein